eukprot:NODE_639_length_5118_cov_0.568440.p5 type:complete len:142 gc:universal NODE_639_length_5118_cov_0.568440:4506-4931(+)
MTILVNYQLMQLILLATIFGAEPVEGGTHLEKKITEGQIDQTLNFEGAAGRSTNPAAEAGTIELPVEQQGVPVDPVTGRQVKEVNAKLKRYGIARDKTGIAIHTPSGQYEIQYYALKVVVAFVAVVVSLMLLKYFEIDKNA